MFFNENILELCTCKLINNSIHLTLVSLPDYLLLDGREMYAAVYGCWSHELEISWPTCLGLKKVKILVLC